MASEAEEAREIINARLCALEAMSWEELDLYGTRLDYEVTPSGRRLQIETIASWDGYDWESSIELGVRVRPDEESEERLDENGVEAFEEDWYGLWAYSGWSRRGGPHDPVPDPPGGWKPPPRFAWLAASGLLIALIIGIGVLGSYVAGASNGAGLAIGLLLTVSAVLLLRRIETRRRPIRRSA